MQIHQDTAADVSVLRLEGRLDANTSKELEERMLPLVGSQGAKLLVDCEDLAYISSAGLRVLLLAVKKAKRGGGQIALAGLNENVMEVFDISGFSALFTIRPNREEGLAALG
ncbi:MAG: STAS domain-containing protein [Armatimonadetes bacterium]|nr:STAS domain-containing protein [Armatimonadota bacterium]